jgi:hypothetical protein
MVRAGEDVQIIDNSTKEDKTEVTLALIISEELKSQPRSVPLGTLRDLIHQRGEKLLSQLREGPIGRLIPGAGLDSRGESLSEGEPVFTEAQDQASITPVVVPPPTPLVPATEVRVGLGEAGRGEGGSFEQWRRAIDERIRTILPTFAAFRELQHRVDQLSSRVAELEAELARRRSE